jgi:homoserine kinase type II
MAVYTHLAAEDLGALIAEYDVGHLLLAKGIAEGISNSNWLVETTAGRFILTLYERRIDPAELPFFLGLLDHLSAKGCAVPRTIHDRRGAAWRTIEGKAAALIEFLPGVSVDRPTAAQAHAVGEALAAMHLAARDFPLTRSNPLDLNASLAALERCGSSRLSEIDPALPPVAAEAAELARRPRSVLPVSICHTDLFPDNVLMLGDRVSGMIDFYFACEEAMAYDLVVAHAAWSFDKSGQQFRPEIGAALVRGYEAARALEPSERAELPALAQAACLRFVASRAEDWLDSPHGALVTRKDPMDFVRRLQFYAEAGEGAFAS